MLKKFTLIELLVVVAIIGILSSMLLPSLSKARKKTEQAVCLSNQHQIGIAIISYADENNAYGPYHLETEGNRWHNRLVPGYLPEGSVFSGTSQVMSCPSAVDVTGAWQSPIAINISLCGDPDIPFLTPRKIFSATPHETMMLIDSYDNWPRSRATYMEPNRVTVGAAGEIMAKHLKKANVSFLDGSSKAKSPGYLYERNQWDHTFWDLEK